MKNFFMRLWNEEEGAETAEWILVVGLLVAVGIYIYTNILSDTLSNVVTTVGAKITSGINTSVGGGG